MSSRPAPRIPYTALLGRILQYHREHAGFQQADVAASIGIMQPAYSRIEKGDTSITVVQLRAVGKVLNVPPWQLLTEAERWTEKLRKQGVTVTNEKEVPKAALVVGLAILAAAMLAASSS